MMKVLVGSGILAVLAIMISAGAVVIEEDRREQSPRLAVAISGVPGYVYYHRDYEISFTYANHGGGSADDVALKVTLPQDFILAGNGSIAEQRVVVWHIGEIGPGESGVVTATLRGRVPSDLTDAVYDLPGYAGHTAFVDGLTIDAALTWGAGSVTTKFLADTGTPPCSNSAPTQWESASGGNDHWYQRICFSSYNQLDWVAAQGAAAVQGKFLVTITSQDEQDFVNSLIASCNCNYWIGAMQDGSPTPPNTAANWMWVEGDDAGAIPEPGGGSQPCDEYSNWNDDDCDPTDNGAGNEPNDDPFPESGNEDCLEMNESGTWNDQQCVLDQGDLTGGYFLEWCEAEGQSESPTGSLAEEFPGLQFVSIQQVPVPCLEFLIIPVGILEICKETDPENDEVFEFNIGGWAGIDRDFELEGDGDCEEWELFVGNYEVTEFAKDGWVVDSVECDPNRVEFDPDTGMAKIDLRLGDTMTCVFTNIPAPEDAGEEEEEEEEEEEIPETRPDISGLIGGILSWLFAGAGQ